MYMKFHRDRTNNNKKLFQLVYGPIKPLLPEFFFRSFLGPFRLPTHSRDAHRNFFL